MASEIFLTSVTETTKQPTGVTIKRDGNKFKISWKIGDKNYKEGQILKWRTNQMASGKWNSIKLRPAVTAKTIELNFSNYIPDTKKALSRFSVEIFGKREDYETGSGKKRTKHVMKWSDGTLAVYETQVPNAPKVSVELDDELNNKSTFTWETSTSTTSKRIFRATEWQTVLLKNSNITDGAKAFKAERVSGSYQTGTSTANNSKSFTEDTSYINGANAYTRWFRIRSRGPKGSSEWTYKKHVYARAYAATDIEARALWIGSGYRINMTWQSSRNNHRPIDKIIVQSLAATPAAGMSPPASASWNDVMTVAYKDGTDGARFVFDEGLDDDQCLFVRVVTVHDREETPSEAAIAVYGMLTDPVLTEVVTVDATHRATITAENRSEVPGSMLAVLYKSDLAPDEEIIVGIIESGTTVTVQCPDWGTSPKSFGVWAFVGDYEPQTREDGVTVYSVSTYDGGMNSHFVWDNGQVPVAPDGVTVTRTKTVGTVRVTWNNTWTEADNVELTWADHEDAWESTDPPASYTVSNVYAAAWNISNLEVGKRWYIRVRLVSGSGDSATPGPWSEIVSISLSEAPAIPALALSQPAIPADGTVTASWGYVSGDGTPQAYAELCTVEITTSGIVYGDIIATVTTPQHVDLDAEAMGWQVGNTYSLCVRVGSASGEVSEWSESNSVMIVPPLEIAITQTSLAEYHVVSTEADTTPYLFRPSPALAEDYDRLLLDKVVGGTLAVNQLVQNGNFATTKNWGKPFTASMATFTVSGNIGTVTITDNTIADRPSIYPRNISAPIAGHKYFVTVGVKYDTATAKGFMILYGGTHAFDTQPNAWCACTKIFSATTDYPQGYLYTSQNGTYFEVGDKINFKDYYIIDLTQMFGTTIADYVYNLEQSTAGSGVAWLKQYYPSIFSSYQAYNAGELMSVEASEHRMTGFNQFDKDASGIQTNCYMTNTGTVGSGIAGLSVSDYIDIIGGQTYYFSQLVPNSVLRYCCWFNAKKEFISSFQTLSVAGTKEAPADARYIRLTYSTSLLDTVCVNISSSRNGEYEPYTQTSYPLDSDLVLRGIPKLNNGVPYYDGDEYKSDGSVNRRCVAYTFTGNEPESSIYSVDVGEDRSGIVYVGLRNTAKSGTHLPIVSDRFVYQASSSPDIGRATLNNAILIIGAPITVTTKAEAIAYLAGATFVCELATPTIEIADTYTKMQKCYMDGTEEFVSGNVVPVGHETEYAKAYDVPTLTDMPLTVTVTGAGETGETTVAIERAESYYLSRPDERNFTGHEGETIALFSQMGAAQITISNEDLIGTLDDGAPYRLVATVQDGFGQSAEASIEFDVHWDHQALMPEATVEIDNVNYVARITPIQPAGAGAGDVCDIYRLSVDRPELIYQGAEFGTTYVDPFPALGEMGGHRIVYRTANGDYITEDNELAWTDYTQADTGGIDTMFNIIDFDNGQVQIMYDINLSAGWDKDFQQTKYLGGHIQGDWNPAVSRTGSVSGSVVTIKDQETIQAMRRLADSAGICHVRTRDGSSFAADVQVSESRDMGQDVIRSEFTLTITRVDPQGYEAMTLDDWTGESE